MCFQIDLTFHRLTITENSWKKISLQTLAPSSVCPISYFHELLALTSLEELSKRVDILDVRELLLMVVGRFMSGLCPLEIRTVNVTSLFIKIGATFKKLITVIF